MTGTKTPKCWQTKKPLLILIHPYQTPPDYTPFSVSGFSIMPGLGNLLGVINKHKSLKIEKKKSSCALENVFSMSLSRALINCVKTFSVPEKINTACKVQTV